ncbi:MAG: helix-turn-helix domain-containing protein, partial [Woeseiaceae bacterium]|nr:helix-turn-helix domain-containing protein [Woeseiaceae bacterium]
VDFEHLDLDDVAFGQLVADLFDALVRDLRDVLSGARRLSGWTRPHTALAERVMPRLRLVGPAALIGVSNDVPSTSHIPRALAEARLALDFADVASRVVRYSQIPFRQMLIAHARDRIQGARPAWLDDFAEANRKSRGVLLETLRAYADADMNVLRTAKHLGVHPNTIYARMQKVRDVSGQNALNYHALTELLLASDAML